MSWSMRPRLFCSAVEPFQADDIEVSAKEPGSAVIDAS
jgi:hypothetical protein